MNGQPSALVAALLDPSPAVVDLVPEIDMPSVLVAGSPLVGAPVELGVPVVAVVAPPSPESGRSVHAASSAAARGQ